MIYFTSDTHFGHNQPFIYEARGFECIEDHDAAIIDNINNIVGEDDELYILGDIYLGGNHEYGVECINAINCRNIHIVCGNHDTDRKIENLRECENVVDIALAARFKYKKISFYLSHYPTMIDNFDNDKKLANHVINLFGHTHQVFHFYTYNGDINPYMYNVGIDANSDCPVSIDTIIKHIKVAHAVMMEEI